MPGTDYILKISETDIAEHRHVSEKKYKGGEIKWKSKSES